MFNHPLLYVQNKLTACRPAVNVSQTGRYMAQGNIIIIIIIIIIWHNSPPVGHGLSIHEVSRSHTMTHHSRNDSSGRVISSAQRTLPDNQQHSQQTFTGLLWTSDQPVADLYLTTHNTHDIHRTSLDEWSARRRELYL